MDTHICRLSIGQIAVSHTSYQDNLQKISNLASKAKEVGSELLCLPELCTTGFHWEANARLYNDLPLINNDICKIAKQHQIYIFGSFLTQSHLTKPSNTALLIGPDGKVISAYSKIHLFSLIDEDKHLQAGSSLKFLDSKWGRFGFAICYDIRFPELFRWYALHGVKAILLPAAFPHPRLHHWQILLRARAIENQMYVIAINQVGKEHIKGKGEITYFGDSCVIDPWGETVIEAKTDDEDFVNAELDMNTIDEVRAKMPVFKDRREDIYNFAI